jgi:hypothetical protein
MFDLLLSRCVQTQEDRQKRKSVFGRVIGTIGSIFSPKQDDVGTMVISAPYNFKHVNHVRPNPRTSTGFDVSILSCCCSSSPYGHCFIFAFLGSA